MGRHAREGRVPEPEKEKGRECRAAVERQERDRDAGVRVWEHVTLTCVRMEMPECECQGRAPSLRAATV